MTDDIARLLYEGAQAVTHGRRDEGRTLLMRVLEQDERNELAWLWLSGAVDDPADQLVALENVLAINPENAAARRGLSFLQQERVKAAYAPLPQAMAAPVGEWTPPPPQHPDEVHELSCWQCSSALYSVAQFCWQCHAPVHCCNNCVFKLETRCKELQGLTSTMAHSVKNTCPWWRPAGNA